MKDKSETLSRSDVDLSCMSDGGDELQKAKDEKLLALLNDMAKGSCNDGGAAEPRVAAMAVQQSSSPLLLPMCSAQVFDNDPVVREGLQECGDLWREVQAETEVKNELHARLLGELRQIQERSERQYQESSSLMQRLMGAKRTLADRLKEASEVNEQLRGRIVSEVQTNDELRAQISDGVRGMFGRGAELSQQIAAISETQGCLAAELRAATESQQRLQSELQRERVSTWRQSTDVVMAFARGGSSNCRSASSASPRTVGTRGVADERRFDESLGDGASPSAPSSASRSPGTAEGSNDELHKQLQSEKSSVQREKVAGSEERSELQQNLQLQGQRIAELSKELALEETMRSSLDAQLLEVARWITSSGIQPPTPAQILAPRSTTDVKPERGDRCQDVFYNDSASIRETNRLNASLPGNLHDDGDYCDVDISATLREVQELRRELAERDAQCRKSVDDENSVFANLEVERAEVEELQIRLQELGAQEDIDIEERNNEVTRLAEEVEAEQDSCERAEQAAAHAQQVCRRQAEDFRNELEALRDINERLADDLSVRSNGCFRRRKPPDSSPSGQALTKTRSWSDSPQSGAESSGRNRGAHDRVQQGQRAARGQPPVGPPPGRGSGRGGAPRPPPPPFRPIRRQNTGDEIVDMDCY
mmetsp:Transcript_20466/g.51613  ORF Transcript_20466/g.51613 Transcript_20466/m.51613 type:complete len:652 (+) Transcript_20466:68-2023(+)